MSNHLRSVRALAGRVLMIGLVAAGMAGPSALAAAPAAAPAQTSSEAVFDPAAFSVGFEPVVEGLSNPLFVTTAGDGSGRLFVLEQTGTIRILTDGAIGAAPFLDISDRITNDGSEQGLLGLAFAPDYSESGLFYVDYTDTRGNTVVSRFAVPADSDVADPASEEIILQQEQPAANHNGGDILFGPDGYLYIALGDGGSQGDPNGNGQNLDTWLGKILRIDVDPANTSAGAAYAVPQDNPFVGTADAKPEVFLYGLRNPWRLSFDRVTGDLYIGDVGQDTYEEIDFVPAGELGGQNFGWNVMEATHCYNAESCDQTGLTLPVAEYAHAVGGCSVTAGYVYRGTDIPALVGTYLYGDYCTGNVWGLGRDATGAWVSSEPIATEYGISSFGEDEDGNLYLTDAQSGTVYRIVAGN